LLSTQPTYRSGRGTSPSFTVSRRSTGHHWFFNYQWQPLAAGNGTWVDLSTGGVYTGSHAGLMPFVSILTMNGDQFLCSPSRTPSVRPPATTVTLTVALRRRSITQPCLPSRLRARQSASFTIVRSAPRRSRISGPVTVFPFWRTMCHHYFANAGHRAGAYTVAITNTFGSACSTLARSPCLGSTLNHDPAASAKINGGTDPRSP